MTPSIAFSRPTLLVGLLLLVSILGAGSSAAAQEIRGRVTSGDDGAPIAGARVLLMSEAAAQVTETTTGESGEYRLEVPEAGRWLVVVENTGFANQVSSPIPVADGETVSYDLSMTVQRVGRTGAASGEMSDLEFLQRYMAESCQGQFTPGIHAIVFGAVRNEATGDPLGSVEVTARWSSGFGPEALTTWSDRSGFFHFCQVPAGEEVQIRAQVTDADVEGPVQRVTMRPGTMSSLDVTIALSDPTRNGNLLGTVRDIDNRQPVIGATVRLRETDRTTTTNDRGVFVFQDVPAGVEVLEVDILGYEDTRQPIQVLGGRSQQMEVLVSAQPFEMDPILVTVRPRSWFSDRSGLEDRMRVGAGFFLLRSDIEERTAAFNLGDLLRAVPGVRVRRRGGGLSALYDIQLRSAANLAGEPCPPRVFLDGNPVGNDARIFSDVTTFDIEAIEVYRGASEIPGEFAGQDSRCGVVVVWTRRGF